MDFRSAWTIASPGVTVSVSDGVPQPDRETEPAAWGRWRTCNFTGTVAEKAPGQLVVKLPPSEDGEVVFTLTEEFSCDITFPEPDLTVAEAVALEKVEEDAEQTAINTVRRARRQAAIDRTWNEIQRFKLMAALGRVPTDPAERRRNFPTLTSLVMLSGNPLPAVATAMEDRLWPQVAKTALWEAKLILGQDAVRAAETAEAKKAAAEAISWTE